MIPTTRAEFEQRILNDLGEPVIKVNLAPIQLENAVDDAIAYWSEFHVDAQERTLIKHTITQDDLDNGTSNYLHKSWRCIKYMIRVVMLAPLHGCQLSMN